MYVQRVLNIVQSLLDILKKSLTPLKKSLEKVSDTSEKVSDTSEKVSDTSQDTSQESAEALPWEVSFGTTQLFEGWFGESEQRLPVSSATLMLSRLLGERFHLWMIFNLPLVPSQEIREDGSTRLARSAPALIFGASVELFHAPLSRKNILSADLGLYGGQVLRSGGATFPLSALRLKLLKGEDTTIYVGLSASVGVDTLGLIYGVGHRF